MRFFLPNASRKFFLLSTLVLFISIGLFGQAGLQQTTQHVPKRVIVKFKPNGDANAIAQFKAQLKTNLGVSKIKRWNKIDAEVWDFANGEVQDIISRWKNDPLIKYIEPDYIVKASVVPNDPRYGDLWGMAKIQAAQAWDTTTGAAVIVGVIDTGVDYLHPDLAANIWTNPGEIPGNGIDDDNNGYIDDVHGYDFANNDGDPMDDHNHGTHCSGTIAGVGNNGIGVVGINWTAKIMALKFLGASGFGNTSDAISAELYATEMGAKLTSNSWGGGGYSQALYDAINAAAAANCLFVAAAGNDNSSFIDYPAGYDLNNIISVAATDINDARASFSNYGATWVDLGAPGVGILSTTRNNTYSSFNGTSMACPHVAGTAALILVRAPLLSYADVKDMILSSVDPVASMAGITVTGGRLNLFKAIVETGIFLRSADPVIAVSPPTVSFSILPDANSNSLLSISNTDVNAKKLNWNITSSPCSWLSINTLSGRVVGGGTQQIQFTADAFGMIPGNYQCTVNINSNDPVNPVVQVIVNLEVLYAPPPVASVSPPSISLALTIGQSADNIVTVSNIAGAGERNLHWSAARQGSSAWLTLTNNSATTAAGASSQMHVLSNAAGLSAGVYNETINITTNDPNNVLIQIPVQLTVTSVPVSGQKIYTFGGNANTIRRANLDGSNAATPFTGLNRPVKGVVDVVNRKLYWAEVGPVRVKRADLDGSNNETLVTSITGTIIAIDLDVANNHMYFFHQVAGQVFRLSRANLDGSNLTTVGDVPGWNFSGLNIDHTNNKLYWYMLGASATGGHVETGIWRSNLDLTNKEHLVTPAADAGGGLSIDFAGGKMYWGESYPIDVIRTATLDGNNQADVLVGYEAGDVAIDPIHGKIYWTHQICVGFDCTYDTKRADLNGSNIQSLGLNGYRLALDLSGASQLTINDVTQNEGHSGPSTYTFTVSLSSPAPAGGVTFDIGTANNTATTSNTDYVQKSLTGQTIPEGSSTYTFDVTVNGDNTIEPDETFFVNVTNVTGAAVSDGQGLGTITNDDPSCIAPAFSVCPSNQSVNALNNACSNIVTYTATATGTPDPTITYAFTGATTGTGNGTGSGSSFNVGVTNVLITATNGCGEPASCTFTVTVVDAQNPSVTCPANITQNNDANQCGAVVTYAATASDNCPGVSVGYSPASGSFFPVGTTTVTATATDAVGRTASCTFTVTVVDAQNPSITCPANITQNNDANQCGAVVTYAATASDNCPGVSVGYSPASGSFFPVGTTTVTATATDAAGRTASCTFTVTVVDAQNPSISCPANITQNNDANQCGAVVTYAATASDNCPGVSVGYSPASGSFFPVGTTTVTATATDAVGRTASCTFTVTVVDAQNPTITCPANITQNNDANQCGAVVTFAATASDNCPGVSVSYSPASGSFFPVGTTTVTVTATDAAANRNTTREAFVGGNTSSCTFTVTVVDAQNPSITCPANITQNNDANQCGAVVTFAATASDNCPGVSVGYSPASGSFFPVGTTTVTATATDAVGRTASCTFTVTVVDAQNPSITCPANITQNNDPNQCGAVVTYAATASDNCPGVSVSYSPASGSFFPVGTTTVTATATDAVGRTASCTFTVTVVDAQNPTIGSCPANITQNNDPNQCGAVVTFNSPSASDNCPGVTVICSPASGSFFPVGTTTVTATATDASGRTASCTFTVTIVDAQNPTITCPANITTGNTAGQCGAFVNYTATANDNCPGTTVSYSPASGSFFPLGTTTVTATATDAAGRTASCTFTVTVADTQGPTLTCPANVTQYITSGCSKKLTPPQPTVIDNCGLSKLTWRLTGATTGNSTSSGVNYVGNITFNAGITTITYTATDIYGNTSACSFTVSILETVLPSITCPPNKTVGTDYGYCFWSNVNLGTPNVSDNCGVASVTNNAPASFPLGTTIVTWTVTDNSGNTRSCNQTIIVLDKQTPSVTCPANIYQDAGPACVTTVTAPNPTYYDNCTVAKLTWVMTGATTGSSPATGINFVGTKNYNVGTTTITYTIKDAANNSWSCSFAVTITDKTRPTITCPANITLSAAANTCNRSIAVPDPTYSDNCGVTKLTWYTSGATNISSPTSGINKIGTKTFNVGVTTVTYTAYDPWGNSKQCTFTITVTDNQPPTASCPGAQTLCKKTNNTYSIPGLTSNDNCSIASITYQVTGVTTRSGTGSNASGLFNLGLSTVTWTVTDASGNTATCSMNVNIVPAGSCRLVSNEPTDDPKTPESKTPSKGKLDLIVQDSKLGVTAYPNPAESYFNVKVSSSSKETVEIRMYDGLGKVVQVKRGAVDQTYRFGDNVVGGMYFIEVRQAGQTATVKVVKL